MNRLPDIMLCYDIGPLDLSGGVPEESGVRRPLVTHDSMQLAAHPLPAPGRLRLEAEQLLPECFFSHTYIVIYENQPRSGLAVPSP